VDFAGTILGYERRIQPRRGMPVERVLDPAVTEAENKNRNNKDDNDCRSRDKNDQEKVRFIRGSLLQIVWKLCQIFLQFMVELLQMFGKRFSVLVLIAHADLDARIVLE